MSVALVDTKSALPTKTRVDEGLEMFAYCPPIYWACVGWRTGVAILCMLYVLPSAKLDRPRRQAGPTRLSLVK